MQYLSRKIIGDTLTEAETDYPVNWPRVNGGRLLEADVISEAPRGPYNWKVEA